MTLDYIFLRWRKESEEDPHFVSHNYDAAVHALCLQQ